MRLQRKTSAEVRSVRRSAVDAEALADAAKIMEEVRINGWPAAIAHAQRLGDIVEGQDALIGRAGLQRALDELPADERALLERTAARVRGFATAQRECLRQLDVSVQGGQAGHRILPLETAGCYAPGGRFPLPSSVIMTAVTANAAGVGTVVVASPRPTRVTQAAACVAGADLLLAMGGAQAIAILTFGARVAGELVVPPCDIVVGPGNKWVTAAKHLATRYTVIDMLAGPSEVLIIADETADPAIVAADMLAQAEHDEDASAILIATSEAIVAAVERELATQLRSLPAPATATKALHANGYALVATSIEEAVIMSDAIAPEHLEVMVQDAESVAGRLKHYGAVFVGTASAEVLGDYGAGPNHVLPTGGLARSVGGLSVLHFMKVQTYLSMEEGEAWRGVCRDAAQLARLEGLEAHARAAEARITYVRGS